MARNRKHGKSISTAKKTVVFVGMAKTSRHLAPWDEPEKEIWVLNESPVHNYQKRFTRLFQLHPRWDALRGEGTNFNDPLYDKWLRNDPWTQEDIDAIEKAVVYKDCYYGPKGVRCPLEPGKPRRTTDFPIYVIDEKDFQDVPGAITYPLKEIMVWLGEEYGEDYYSKEGHYIFEYFTSTVNFMIALAIYEKVDRIELFGFEMSSREEYSYQKAATEFWLGMALGRGIEIYLPPGCALLGENERIYGYEKTPGYSKMHCEIRMNEVRMAREKAVAKLNAIHGQKATIMGAIEDAREKGQEELLGNLKATMVEITKKEIKSIAEVNSLHGAWYELDRIYKELTAQKSDDKVGTTVLPSRLRDKI